MEGEDVSRVTGNQTSEAGTHTNTPHTHTLSVGFRFQGPCKAQASLQSLKLGGVSVADTPAALWGSLV